MANIADIQILTDGPRHTVVKLSGILDTADIAVTDLLDPALRSDMGPFAGMKASQYRIDKITYEIEDTLAVNLFWDATADVLIASLVGRGEIDAYPYGGLQNNSGAGKTGKIQYSTAGWAVSGVLSFTLILECSKQ